jgi:hypothetical protein
MIIIGLLLVIAAGAFGIDLILTNHHHLTDPSVFGQSLGLANDAAIFIVGAITGAAVLFGITLMAAGMRHKASRGVSHHRERKAARALRLERDDLAEQNERLSADLTSDRERVTAGSAQGSREETMRGDEDEGAHDSRIAKRRASIGDEAEPDSLHDTMEAPVGTSDQREA